MKICFHLQRNYAPVGDAIALHLKEKYESVEFCALVASRSANEYVCNNAKVKYSSVIYDEEIHERYKNETLDYGFLREFESKYGLPNLWPYLVPDRVLMSSQLIREYPYDRPLLPHEDLLRLVQVNAKAVMAFLDAEKPDAVVFSVVGNLPSLLLYHVAKARGIATRVIFPALIPDRYIISESHDHFSLTRDLGETFARPLPHDVSRAAAEYVREFRARPKPYLAEFSPDNQQVTRADQLRFILPGRLIRSVYAVFREFSLYYAKGRNRDYSSVNPWHFVVDRMRRKIRNFRGLRDMYDAPIKGERYAFFPLQYEPEVSLSVQSPHLNDQLLLAKALARALPVGWKLYVKEHPVMVEFRPRKFYRALKNIPNVALVDPSIKGTDLIAGAGLVGVITSTAGFEAAILRKPLLTFGNQFFNDFSAVAHVEKLADLPRVVESLIGTDGCDDAEIIHYIGKMMESSAMVKLQDIWMREHDANKRSVGVAPLADLLGRSLGMISKQQL